MRSIVGIICTTLGTIRSILSGYNSHHTG
jgi:hypothetical protein